ncbi:zinc finger protein RFP [Periophthalmus magnuspinnatus]|uniref:zinc finger protein RFP n=1 Tax=Periophthalmus magnuspinnatus TaxID=409849 RepID=UPI00243679ED|nr:zinc finger protein RFP [Periophthalmus magnuspinnatus]
MVLEGAQMERTEEELQQMIQEKLQRVENISHNISLSREQTSQDLQQSEQIFSSLMAHLQKVQEEVVEQIQRTQEQAEHRAHSLVSQLQQEVKELQRNRQELELLRKSQDHLHLVQCFSTLTLPAPALGCSMPIHTDPSLGTVRTAVARLEQEVQKILRLLCEQELERMQKYAVDVTFDPHTANPWLVLSEDRRRVWDGDQEQVLEQRPERFDIAPCVLGDKGFTSRRHYWEVEVGGKTAWDVGVARGSVSRTGMVTLSPDDGYWTVCLRRGREYWACAEAMLLPLCPPYPRVLALFLDHEQGHVSFYDVEAREHLYSYTGFRFTEALFPFFNPETSSSGGDNTAPLVIRTTRILQR